MPYGTERERLSTEVFPKEGCICCQELPCPAPEFYVSESGGLHYGWLPSPSHFHDDIVHDLPESAFRMLWLTRVNDEHHNGSVTATPAAPATASTRTKTDVIDYDQYIFIEDALRTMGTADNPWLPTAVKVCSGTEENTGDSPPTGTWGVAGATEGGMEDPNYDEGGHCLLTWDASTDTSTSFYSPSETQTIDYKTVISETELLQEKAVTVAGTVGGTTYGGDYTVEKGYKDPLPFLYTVRLAFPNIDSPMLKVRWDVEFRPEGQEEYSKEGEEVWEAVGHDALRLGGNFMHNYPYGSFGDFRITNVRFRCSPGQRFRDYGVESAIGPVALSTETAFA